MKNSQLWEPSKFIFDRLTSSWIPNINYPGISSHSYIIAYNQINFYQRFIEKYVKGMILDCGCGDAPFYGIYKNITSDVYCIDWENTGAKQIHIDEFVNLNEEIDLPNESFDSILLSDVLEHIANPDSLLSELNRIIKLDGHLIIMVPFLYRIHEEPHDYYRYTEYALKHLLLKNGFEVMEIQSYGGVIDVIFDLFNKVFFNTKKRSRILFKIYNFTINRGRFNKINEERRNSFPLGYCVAARKIVAK